MINLDTTTDDFLDVGRLKGKNLNPTLRMWQSISGYEQLASRVSTVTTFEFDQWTLKSSVSSYLH